MSEHAFYDIFLTAWFILAGAVFICLFFITAPYGRHLRKKWRPAIGNRTGWMIMEAPAALLFAIFFITGKSADTLTAAIFLIMWEAHYLHRSFIYPLRFRDNTKKMPVIIAGMAFFFNVVNAYLNGRYLFDLSGGYSPEWLGGPRFLIGCVLFIIGMIINQQADGVLRRLRKQGESVYRIPRGGLYRWISCPNYFGEILEWSGWAIATWSPAGLSFAVWTIAVLLPRARSHHIWYRAHFSDYPPGRKILFPGIW